MVSGNTRMVSGTSISAPAAARRRRLQRHDQDRYISLQIVTYHHLVHLRVAALRVLEHLLCLLVLACQHLVVFLGLLHERYMSVTCHLHLTVFL